MKRNVNQRSRSRVLGLLATLMVAVFCMLFSGGTIRTYAAIATGTCGTCNWVIDDEGVLTISPANGTNGTLDSVPSWSYGFWRDYETSIKKIFVQPGVKAGSDCHHLFYNLSKCTEIDVSNLDTSNTVNMSKMFYGLSSINNMDLSSLDTSKATNMERMCMGCTALKSIDISSFDTSKCTTMEALFGNDHQLTSIKVGSKLVPKGNNIQETANPFDTKWFVLNPYASLSNNYTGKWIHESGAYGPCEEMEFPNYYTPQMAGKWVFEPKELPYAVFDETTNTLYFVRAKELHENGSVGHVHGISGEYTGQIYKVDEASENSTSTWSSVSNQVEKVIFVDTIKPKSTNSWFKNFKNVREIDIKNLDTSNTIRMNSMFQYCEKLVELDVSGFDLSNVSTGEYMFQGCNSITELDVSDWQTISLKNMHAMFAGCNKLETLDVSNFDTSNVTNMWEVFCNDYVLKELDVSNWNTSKVTKMSYLFSGCRSLSSLDLNNFDTSNATEMNDMFQGCKALTALDLSNFTTRTSTTLHDMFQNCDNLRELDISGFTTNTNNRSENMFSGCSKLERIKLSPDFTFKMRTTVYLPTPPPSYTTGKWIREDEAFDALSPEQLTNDYVSSMNGTWIWEIDTHSSVTHFDANGGYTTASTIVAKDELPDISMPTDSTTSRPGYYLKGWSDSKDGSSTIYKPGETVTGIARFGTPLVLYAQWISEADAIVYTVEHYLQNDTLDGYLDTPSDSTGRVLEIENESYTATPGNYDNYKFSKAELDPADAAHVEKGSDHTYIFNRGSKAVVRYYYDHETFTVTFDDNSEGQASGQMRDQTVLRGRQTALASNIFSWKAHIFTGWNTAADGSGTSYTDMERIRDLAEDGGNIKLYAQWLDNSEGEHSATNGELIVTIKAGETLVIPDLPDGTKYTIEEINLPDGWSKKGEIDGDSGAIEAITTSSATATNTYKADGTAYIVAHKKLKGDTPSSGEFHFELLDSEGEVIDTADNDTMDTAEESAGDDGEATDNPWHGTAPVRFKGITYTEPGTYTYTVKEIKGEETRIKYDEHEETVTVTVTDAGGGVLNTSVEYDDDGALFTNELNDGSLEISKRTLNATAAAAETEFAFTVVLKDASGNEIEGSYPYQSGERSGSVSSGGTIMIKGGETVTITKLPHGAQYEITEVVKQVSESGETVWTAGVPAGWEQTGTEGASGTIEADETAAAVFENTYTTVGSVEVHASKTLVGRDLTDREFRFELVDISGTVVDQAYTDADGNVTLHIDFTQEQDGQTMTYMIREVESGDTSVVYDTHSSRVQVTVTDDGEGKLVGEVSYPDNNTTFTNLVMKKLTVTKHITGNYGNLEDVFDITLKLQGGDLKEIPQGVNVNSSESTGDVKAYTFSLGHDESITFEMPINTEYEIEEDAQDYKCSIELTPEEEGQSIDGTKASGKLDKDTTAAYTNTKHGTVPTGVNAPVRVGMMLSAIGALGALVLLDEKKRRCNHRKK